MLPSIQAASPTGMAEPYLLKETATNAYWSLPTSYAVEPPKRTFPNPERSFSNVLLQPDHPFLAFTRLASTGIHADLFSSTNFMLLGEHYRGKTYNLPMTRTSLALDGCSEPRLYSRQLCSQSIKILRA